MSRVAPLSPADAIKSFKIADGFRIEQVAAEPLVFDPVAMAFDEWGRLYVVEMRDYSEQDRERLGRVRLLVDRGGDGRFDHSTVFAKDISWPTAVACYGGGVFIGAAPDLLYCKDTNNDGVADSQEVVCTGFGRDNVQGLLNSFQWGLDNRIHGSTSSTGAKLVVPGASAEPIELRGRDFALDPRTRKIVPTTGGGQHGMTFNRWGDRFVCQNSDHFQAIVFEDRYLSRNAYQAAPPARRSIAADGPQAEVFRASPVEAWRLARTKLRVAGLAPGPIEGGGRASGYFTSATGITIYEGDLWPEEYRGWAIVADVGSNLIHRKRVVPDGVTYRGERVDQGGEFLTSTDIWFRPVQMASGPDGALYICDMYREVIEHPASLPPEIKSQLDLTSGRDRGRIYRIVPASYEQARARSLGDANAAELVGSLNHANQWHRATAARLLYERMDKAAIAPLRKLASHCRRPESRIAALYALDGISALDTRLLLEALGNPHPQVRRHAIRLCESRLAESAELRERLAALVADDDIRVRFQLALSLGEVEGPAPAKALAKLMVADAGNADVVGAVLSSIATCAGAVLRELAKNDRWLRTPEARPIITEIARQIQRQQRDDDIRVLIELLAPDGRVSRRDVASHLLVALGRPDGTANSSLVAELREMQRDAASALVASAKTTLENDAAAFDDRVAAIRILGLGDFDSQRGLFAEQLSPLQAGAVQKTVLETLAGQDSPQVASLVLAAWEQLTPDLRRQAVELLSQRETWLHELFTALEGARVAVADINPADWAAWSRHPSEAVRRRVAKLRRHTAASNRLAVFQSYKEVLQDSGDAARGQQVFIKQCASCHRLGTEGHEMGPNLAAMTNRGAEAILFNILVPNAEIESRYVDYTLITTEGRVLTGMIASETANSVTLRGANNETHSILRVDIDELRSSGTSLMPDGLEQFIDRAAMADLLAYLREATSKSMGKAP